mgnify:CR=1 FL=1|tara:strand:- start:2742 stop:3431 length:690 start_codon:yes stop_codon:yes gene_type:complete
MAGNSPSFRTVRLTLDANGEQAYNTSGNVIAVISADGAFEMSFGDDSFFETEAGLGYAPDDGTGLAQTFRTLRFRDTSGLSNEVRVQIGTGRISDNRAVFGNSELPVKTNPATELQVKTKAGTSLSVMQADEFLPKAKLPNVVAAQGTVTVGASISALVVTGTGGNNSWVYLRNTGTETMFITGTATFASNGIALAAGETIGFEHSGAVYVANPAAFSQGVAVTFSKWV